MSGCRLSYLHEISSKVLYHGNSGSYKEREINLDSFRYFASGPELFPSGDSRLSNGFPVKRGNKASPISKRMSSMDRSADFDDGDI